MVNVKRVCKKMKREVEILVEVLDSKERALKALEKFHFEGEKETHDIYFFDPERDHLKPSDKGRLKNSLRLRKKGNTSYLTYKKDNFNPDGSWICSDEHETKVSDYDVTKDILLHIGVEVLTEVRCTKYIFKDDKYEIVLEDVKNLGIFIEVESLDDVEEDQVVKEKKRIWGFMNSLGIRLGEELDAGKPELMLNK